MRCGLLILFLSFLVAGCKNKNRVPAGILPTSKMQAVLWDIMRADQFLTDYRVNKDTALDTEAESIKLYRQIFSIHDISREEFQKSFSFYQSHPVLLKEIMDSMSKPPAVAPAELIKPKDSIFKIDSLRAAFLNDSSRRFLKKKIRLRDK